MKSLKLIVGLVISISLVIILSQCKKDEDRYRIRGRLLISCDNNLPKKGFRIDLYNREVLNCDNSIIASSTTNENGEFEFIYYKTYKSNYGGGGSIEFDNSFSTAIIAGEIRLNSDVNVGDIYLEAKSFFNVKIKTNKSYSINDTLFYDIKPIRGGFDSTYSFVVGPFADGIVIDNLQTTVSLTKQLDNVADPVNYFFRWILKSNGTPLLPFTGTTNIYVEPCKTDNEVAIDLSK